MEITRDWLEAIGFRCYESGEGIYFRNGSTGILKSFNVWLPFKIINERAFWSFIYVETREQFEALLRQNAL